MRKLGIPEFSKDGFLILGGGGFVDLPIKSLSWMRVGGSGTGFSSKREVTDPDGKKRTVYYDYGSGGMSVDYVGRVGKKVEYTLGLLLSTGKLTIQMYQSVPGYGNWNTIFNELNGNGVSQNISHELSVRFYSLQPQAGFGYFLADFLYVKLNAGYQFSVNQDWKADDGIAVTGAPEGIKANGFNFNLGLNFGLFTK